MLSLVAPHWRSTVVVLTAVVFLVGTAAEDEAGQPAVDSPQNTALDGQEPVGEGAPQSEADVEPHQSFEEATATIRELVYGFMAVLPKILVALFLLLMAWILAVVLRWGLHKTLSGWERSEAVAALMRIGLFLLAIAAGLSVIADDATALLGSVGLIGLALSWALQTPIESFTGWVLNAFRGYYRPGDRIEVGDVFGDVYRIDVLTVHCVALFRAETHPCSRGLFWRRPKAPCGTDILSPAIGDRVPRH